MFLSERADENTTSMARKQSIDPSATTPHTCYQAPVQRLSCNEMYKESKKEGVEESEKRDN